MFCWFPLKIKAMETVRRAGSGGDKINEMRLAVDKTIKTAIKNSPRVGIS